MGFGTPPTVLEGDYSDWSIYDSFDDADARLVDLGQEAIVNREETMVVIIDADQKAIKQYNIATKTLSAALATGIIWEWGDRNQGISNKSAYGTYVVATNLSNVYVFKDGSIQKTLSYTDLGLDDLTIESTSISPKGKYIFVSGRSTVTGNIGWVVLEGS